MSLLCIPKIVNFHRLQVSSNIGMRFVFCKICVLILNIQLTHGRYVKKLKYTVLRNQFMQAFIQQCHTGKLRYNEIGRKDLSQRDRQLAPQRGTSSPQTCKLKKHMPQRNWKKLQLSAILGGRRKCIA